MLVHPNLCLHSWTLFLHGALCIFNPTILQGSISSMDLEMLQMFSEFANHAVSRLERKGKGSVRCTRPTVHGAGSD
jgi:hypothetical protein